MNGFSYLDAAIVAAALLIAVSSLTRLMRARRDRLVAEVQDQWNTQQQRRKQKKKAESS